MSSIEDKRIDRAAGVVFLAFALFLFPGCGEEPGPIGVNAETRDSHNNTNRSDTSPLRDNAPSQYPAGSAMVKLTRHLTAWHDCEKKTVTLTITENGTVSDQFGNTFHCPNREWSAWVEKLRDPQEKANKTSSPSRFPDGLGTLRSLIYEFEVINANTLRVTCLGEY